jgi:D-methionine transport system substrate-binding protein
MRKLALWICALVLAVGTLGMSTMAMADSFKIAIPNDPTNEGRALLLLQSLGVLELNPEAGITATVKDITSTKVEIEFTEMAAENLPNVLPDVDFAIINNNFALDAGLNPAADGLARESSDSPYSNVLCVKEENKDSDATKALIAAFTSQKVVDYINTTYTDGSVVAVIDKPTDGYDATVDYEALKGTKLSIAVTPVPHEPIANIAKEILAEKGIELEVIQVTDYVTPNDFVEAGDVYANFFAHIPYQESFNADNGTHLAIVAPVHVEPMAIYGGQTKDLTVLTPAK